MNNLHFYKRINRFMLQNYSKEDLYVYKKAQIMLNVSIGLLFAGIASAVAHSSKYALGSLMYVGILF